MEIFWVMVFAFVYILIGYVVTVLLEYCDGDVKIDKWIFMLAWPLCVVIAFIAVIILSIDWLTKKLSGGE